MKVVVDNDAFLKLASLGLLTKLPSLLGIPASSILINPTLVHRLNGKAGGLTKNHSQKALDVAAAFAKSCALIRTFDQSEVDGLVQFPDIDVGEAILVSATKGLNDFLLITGDKRSIRAIQLHLPDGPIKDRLKNNLVCVEQVILCATRRMSFGDIIEEISEGCRCDTAIEKIFSKGANTPKDEAELAMRSTIKQLRMESGMYLRDNSRYPDMVP